MEGNAGEKSKWEVRSNRKRDRGKRRESREGAASVKTPHPRANSWSDRPIRWQLGEWKRGEIQVVPVNWLRILSDSAPPHPTHAPTPPPPPHLVRSDSFPPFQEETEGEQPHRVWGLSPKPASTLLFFFLSPGNFTPASVTGRICACLKKQTPRYMFMGLFLLSSYTYEHIRLWD